MFAGDYLKKRRLIFELSKNDFYKKFKGSYLGAFWAFVNPVITILLYWFVFAVGFRTGATPEGFPFVVWLICGMVPWFFFSEALMSATLSFMEYSFLVKKVVFKISVLPVVKIISAFFIHVFFVLFLIVVLAIYNVTPSFFWIQLIYYLACMIFLLIGVTFITASVMPFFKDMAQLISVVIQIGFWLTPIVWTLDIAPEKYHFWFKLNPFYYIAEGYRDTFLYETWFWAKPLETLYFWTFSLSVFVLGCFLYKKLKPHFSDVL